MTCIAFIKVGDSDLHTFIYCTIENILFHINQREVGKHL